MSWDHYNYYFKPTPYSPVLLPDPIQHYVFPSSNQTASLMHNGNVTMMKMIPWKMLPAPANQFELIAQSLSSMYQPHQNVHVNMYAANSWSVSELALPVHSSTTMFTSQLDLMLYTSNNSLNTKSISSGVQLWTCAHQVHQPLLVEPESFIYDNYVESAMSVQVAPYSGYTNLGPTYYGHQQPYEAQHSYSRHMTKINIAPAEHRRVKSPGPSCDNVTVAQHPAEFQRPSRPVGRRPPLVLMPRVPKYHRKGMRHGSASVRVQEVGESSGPYEQNRRASGRGTPSYDVTVAQHPAEFQRPSRPVGRRPPLVLKPRVPKYHRKGMRHGSASVRVQEVGESSGPYEQNRRASGRGTLAAPSWASKPKKFSCPPVKKTDVAPRERGRSPIRYVFYCSELSPVVSARPQSRRNTGTTYYFIPEEAHSPTVIQPVDSEFHYRTEAQRIFMTTLLNRPRPPYKRVSHSEPSAPKIAAKRGISGQQLPSTISSKSSEGEKTIELSDIAISYERQLLSMTSDNTLPNPKFNLTPR